MPLSHGQASTQCGDDVHRCAGDSQGRDCRVSAAGGTRRIRIPRRRDTARLVTPHAPRQLVRYRSADQRHVRTSRPVRTGHRRRGKSRIEVTNSLPQSSHDQVWSIRPRILNRDCSAMSRTLPQRGQLGRPRFSVVRPQAGKARQADWTVIVDPLRRPHRTLSYLVCCVWRHGDRDVKLSWRNPQLSQPKRASSWRIAGLMRLNRRTIGAAGHQTILKLAAGIKLVCQKPADYKQKNDNSERNERPAPITFVPVVSSHGSHSASSLFGIFLVERNRSALDLFD